MYAELDWKFQIKAFDVLYVKSIINNQITK